MGIYLNPGNENFKINLNGEFFVDKTEQIQFLNSRVNTPQRFVSVSRPRRFGKTFAADMICAYYDRTAESRSLFETTLLPQCEPVVVGKEAIHWDAYLKKFDVVHLTMTDFFGEESTIADSIKRLREEVAGELMDEYPDVRYGNNITLRTVMAKIFAKHKKQFVVVIDEWDAVFRYHGNDFDGQKIFLDNLRDWLKDKPYIALAYMTGILPIKKYGGHSALNMFNEFSMTQPMMMAQYIGFTEAEVRRLCNKYNMLYGDIEEWYDGYRLSDYIPIEKRALFREGGYTEHRFRVYSPLSVLKAMRNGIIDDYWDNTETYYALAKYIRMDFDGLKDTVALLMDGGRARVSLKTYQNDMSTFQSKDDILALLVHLGYLGFEGDEKNGRVDSTHGEVFIPNKEILEEYKASTGSDEWAGTFERFNQSLELLEATWAGKADKVAGILEKAHDRASNLTYNDEAALSYAIQLAYYAAGKYYSCFPELDSGKGFADVAYIPSPRYPGKPALLVELKYNKDADTAISQIKRKEYPARLEHYKGNILMVGIDYDKEAPSTSPGYKRHTCRIEKA